MSVQAPPSNAKPQQRAAGIPLPQPTVLIVDDERLIRWSLSERLKQQGWRVVEAANARQAQARFREGVDLVLLDFGLPDLDGLEVLASMHAEDPELPVIMLTAHATVEMAVEAMRQGAYHYTGKPFDLDVIAHEVQRALEETRLRRRVRQLLDNNGDACWAGIVGISPAIQRAKERLCRVAASPASTILITGESGTGKDLAARTIHSYSSRARQALMNITCSALPETLLESELFGHERGAFTDAKNRKKGLLEMASGGTVFLDEIAEMTPALQAKLLGFLEEKSFRRLGGAERVRPDVRVVAATHQDLQAAIAEGRFRADLFFRLAVLHVDLPPLRERHGDLPILAHHLIDRFNREFDRNIRGLSAQALARLEAHPWPGNVRELRNTIERAVLLSDGDVLQAEDLELEEPRTSDSGTFQLPPEGISFQELERELLVQALEQSRGNQTRAARLLGMTRDQVRYRVAKFGLSAESA